MKDLAEQYFAEDVMASQEANREKTPVTVRLNQEDKARLQRLADFTGKSMNIVAADILQEGALQLGIALAHSYEMSTQEATKLIDGVEYPGGTK